jgi:hypothetical protein
MGDQSGLEFSTFSVLFESALEKYARETGKPLAQHPLAELLECCNTVESVSDILQEQARTFNQSINSRITKSLNSIISILYTLSTTTAIRSAINAVRRTLAWPFHFSHTCSIAFPSRSTNIYRPGYPPWCMYLSSLPTPVSCNI